VKPGDIQGKTKGKRMELTGLHLLMTYQCTLECDHCFVWGSPNQNGTMTLKTIREILEQARDLPSVTSIYFEGGEPFLYFSTMLKGVQEAARAGFEVGLVTNAYWATDVEDATEWLRPLAGLVSDLSVSSDLYHSSERQSKQSRRAAEAARQLGIPTGTISIAQPEGNQAAGAVGQLPTGETAVMYRGRAAEKLAAKAGLKPWEQFTNCPHENLEEPGRVHIDPLGYVHICQGISLGNLFQTPLREICAQYIPAKHPITGPLLKGGPAELVRKYDLSYDEKVADACHLCYEARLRLRGRFPDILTPDQMYGIMEAQG
jgi:MoaA/NifB/PqqE/SkfB family radical SAM enzyme